MSCSSTPVSTPLTPSQTGSSSIHNSPYMPAGTKRKVLVIGTGGTIASEPTANGYSPVSRRSPSTSCARTVTAHSLTAAPERPLLPPYPAAPAVVRPHGRNDAHDVLLACEQRAGRPEHAVPRAGHARAERPRRTRQLRDPRPGQAHGQQRDDPGGWVGRSCPLFPSPSSPSSPSAPAHAFHTPSLEE